MAVYLVRHAEDRGAAEARFGDFGLTPRGLAQASEAARALARIPFERCVTSPLERALETARCLVAERGVPLEVEPVFAEGSLGQLAGLSHAEAAAEFPRDLRLGHSVVARLAASGRTAPVGEERAAFLDRADLARAYVARALEATEENLLVVSHGGLLNFLLQLLLGMPVRDEV